MNELCSMLVVNVKRKIAPKLDRHACVCGLCITILDGVAKNNLTVKVIFE